LTLIYLSLRRAKAMSVKFFDKNNKTVVEIMRRIRDESAFDFVFLFGGERWYLVEKVGVLYQDKVPVAVASLCPTDEMGQGEPHIIGIYVFKDHRRKGYGEQLTRAMIGQSEIDYGKPPVVDCISQDSYNVAKRLEHLGLKANPFF
jgi:GNAT superfamily N-acetyltransferase